ncbi:MAG: hypothetical protein LBQ69_03535 [Treponema sp.]|jgi:hypothetical protein|nr:hypothetical protein [Treponema sp.]
MNAVTLAITLLILVAIVSQAVAFIITLKIRRKAGDGEGSVLDFSEWKDRIKSEVPPEAPARKPTDE